MRKTKSARPRAEVSPLPAAAKNNPRHDLGRTTRETVESIVIAFVLAFLFRTFEAEAFVIPTGSMAPTLQGRHKDLECKNCGYRVRASASEEDRPAESASRSHNPDWSRVQRETYNSQVVAVTCPLCRYRTDITHGNEHETYNGDRIIVAKFPYEFVDPKRWDIVVFKFPNDAKTNYIKRLVGLPEETVRIHHGNIFTMPKDGTEYQIERKPPDKQMAIAQIVYDNNHVVPSMTQKGWPPRWRAWPLPLPLHPESTRSRDAAAGENAGWIASEDGKSFETGSGKQSGPAWLRYQHFPPTQSDWADLKDGAISADDQPHPQLITDFYAYNNGILRGTMRPPGTTGLDWVGDLMLEARVDVRGEQGRVLLDLVEGGVHFRAAIDVASGEVALSIDGVGDYQPKATTSVRGAGSYRLAFANFDDQLTLWIDGSPVHFDAPTTYGPLNNDQPRSTADDAGDLAPVGIGVDGGLAATVRDLVVKRDIYYIAAKYDPQRDYTSVYDYRMGAKVPMKSSEELASFFSDPEAWRRPSDEGLNEFELRREVTFPLATDQFFVLGDNSPASADSRLWEDHHHFVEREMMIGKALFIYWPHSFYHLPLIGLPYIPNLRDMGFVR